MKDRRFKNHPAVQQAEYLAALALLGLLRAIPLRAVGLVARGIGSLAFGLLRSHRERAIHHLEFAGVASCRSEAEDIARRSFQSLALNALECVKLDQHLRRVGGDPSVCIRHYDARHVEGMARGGAAIVIGCHYGNWELATRVFDGGQRRFHLVVRRRHNAKLDALIARWRGAEAKSLIDHRRAGRALLRALRAGEMIVTAGDQRAKPREGIGATFFGHSALTHTAPAQLHLHTDAPLFIIATRRVGGPFDYEMVLRGPLEIERSGDRKRDVHTLTQLYTSEVETIIREDPTQWVWAHRRWHDPRHEALPTSRAEVAADPAGG